MLLNLRDAFLTVMRAGVSVRLDENYANKINGALTSMHQGLPFLLIIGGFIADNERISDPFEQVIHMHYNLAARSFPETQTGARRSSCKPPSSCNPASRRCF